MPDTPFLPAEAPDSELHPRAPLWTRERAEIFIPTLDDEWDADAPADVIESMTRP